MHLLLSISLGLAVAVFLATAAMDFLYVLYARSVAAGRRIAAATFSMIWHLVTALIVVVYLKNMLYLACVGIGGWLGSYFGMGFAPPVKSKAPERQEG